MGIGPAVAIPAAVKSAGLELNNVDLFEINEVKDFLRLSWLHNLKEILARHSYLLASRPLLPNTCTALRNWSLILRKSTSMEVLLRLAILWVLQVCKI